MVPFGKGSVGKSLGKINPTGSKIQAGFPAAGNGSCYAQHFRELQKIPTEDIFIHH